MGIFFNNTDRLISDLSAKVDKYFVKLFGILDSDAKILTQKFDDLDIQYDALNVRVDKLFKESNDVKVLVKALRLSLYKPGVVTLVPLGEDMDVISFKVVLPTLADASVVSRELSVKIGDTEPQVKSVAADAVEVDGFSGAQDSALVLALTDIDEAGNRSQTSTLDAVLADTFPPATPGVLSIQETGEAVA